MREFQWYRTLENWRTRCQETVAWQCQTWNRVFANISTTNSVTWTLSSSLSLWWYHLKDNSSPLNGWWNWLHVALWINVNVHPAIWHFIKFSPINAVPHSSAWKSAFSLTSCFVACIGRGDESMCPAVWRFLVGAALSVNDSSFRISPPWFRSSTWRLLTSLQEMKKISVFNGSLINFMLVHRMGIDVQKEKTPLEIKWINRLLWDFQCKSKCNLRKLGAGSNPQRIWHSGCRLHDKDNTSSSRPKPSNDTGRSACRKANRSGWWQFESAGCTCFFDQSKGSS